MRYQIHRGGQTRTVKGVVARDRMRRLAHDDVVKAQGNLTIREIARIATSIVWFWTDLRRGQRSIYGALLGYIDISIRLGRSREELKQIPQWISSYIDEQCDPSNTDELKLVA